MRYGSGWFRKVPELGYDFQIILIILGAGVKTIGMYVVAVFVLTSERIGIKIINEKAFRQILLVGIFFEMND